MARPNGVLEKVAALMSDGTCACNRLGTLVDAVFSSWVSLSVVAVQACINGDILLAGLAVSMGCSPHIQIEAIARWFRWMGRLTVESKRIPGSPAEFRMIT